MHNYTKLFNKKTVDNSTKLYKQTNLYKTLHNLAKRRHNKHYTTLPNKTITTHKNIQNYTKLHKIITNYTQLYMFYKALHNFNKKKRHTTFKHSIKKTYNNIQNSTQFLILRNKELYTSLQHFKNCTRLFQHCRNLYDI